MTKARGRDGLAGNLAPLLACLAIAPGLLAQSSLRGWGGARFDTAAYSLPALDLAAAGSGTAVLRADGRIFTHGTTQLPEGPPAPAGATYTAIGISDYAYPAGTFGFGLLSNGTIVSWGTNGTGMPAPALPPNTTYVQLAVGYAHALALRSDGIAIAWGDNSAGQSTVPALPPGVTVQQVYARGSTSMLLLANGTLVAFGGLTAVPALPPGVTYTAAWLGLLHAIARRSDGAITSWGNNTSGQGNVPIPPAGVTYTTMALGSYHTVAARSDGAVVAWGDNYFGQCNVPTLPGTAAQLVCGYYHSLVRLTNGAVIGWGSTSFEVPTPALPPGEQWTGVASGPPALGLTSSGQVLPLGNTVAVPVLPPGYTYTAVAASYGHYAALRSDGRAFAWGDNTHGECAIPPLPPGMSYTAIDASFGRTVMLRSDGMAVECGNYGAVTIPALPPGARYVQISCHSHGTMLRRSDGAIVVVGGQDNRQQNVPVLPAGLHYTSIAMTRCFSAALRSDGEVMVWGSAPAVPLPPLPAGVVYVQIDGGDDQLAARRSDGQVAVATLAGYDNFANAPVAAAGESFVDISAGYGTGALRVVPTSTYASFATGCAGSRPASRLVPTDTPRIGHVLLVNVLDLPQDAAVMVFGWQRTAPIPLGPLGLPGCSQHITADAAVLLLGQDAAAQYRLAIPNAIGLIGLAFRNQAVVFDPPANAAGVVVSDAAEGVIGNW